MKILQTAILLFITLFVVPLFTYFFGTAPGTAEWEAISVLLIIAAAAAGYSFIAGEITGNNSQVDKLWSLLPIAYAWVTAHYGDYSLRLVVMALLVTAWGARLTFNFALKGAYQWRFWTGEEDYRWVVLRRKPEFQPRWRWTLFNLFFISGYQMALILLFTLPTVVAMQNSSTPWGPADWIISGMMLFFILFETVADIQQWNYQERKRLQTLNGGAPDEDIKKGFLDKGLWAWSRHPNYFAEQAIWVCFYLFSVSSGGGWFNWSISGCLLLIVLFQGSSNFSEEISAGKYPGYSRYRERVSRFIPFPPGKA